MKLLHTPILFSLCALLVSCGGGSDPEPTCSSESVLMITAMWNSNGTVARNVQGKVGVPLTARPVVTGIPPSCLGKESFVQAETLPEGLSLDTATGVISGTPRKANSTSVPGYVKLKLPGYTDITILTNISISS